MPAVIDIIKDHVSTSTLPWLISFCEEDRGIFFRFPCREKIHQYCLCLSTFLLFWSLFCNVSKDLTKVNYNIIFMKPQ